MAKKIKQNKIGESFEQQLPDELVPDFIWDNISNTLDEKNVVTESTEKIKASFEEGFTEEVVPPLLWTGIESSLTGGNKIKTSFEAEHQDILPENLWENVENQLEVEGVWKRVLSGLNRRTKRLYWQEKGMQFGIAALALLLLRGCDFGDWTSILPIADQSNVTAKVDSKTPQFSPVLTANSNAKTSNNSEKSTIKSPTTINNNQSPKDNLLEQTYTLPTSPVLSLFSETLSKENLRILSPVVAPNKNAPILEEGKLEVNSNDKATITTPFAQQNMVFDNASKIKKKEQQNSSLPSNSILVNKKKNTSSSDKTKNLPSNDLPTAKTPTRPKQNILASKTVLPSDKPTDTRLNDKTKQTNTIASKTLLSETAISTLAGEAFVDPSIENLYTFEIDNVVNKKKHNIRFELGMNGKVGTSLLLGNATNKAMEETSMVKTKMRAAGSVGIMLDCYLTANDAIVFGAYPLSNSQQYFGGYTNEGRYYHKEVKLAYFDFSLGYQRTLFHYNDFGTVPSSMYARVDYGLGYLSKSEEIVNGLAAELGDSYNKFNHNIGLTIGNTHRINRFVIDYGIYGNIGLSSVQNVASSGISTIEYNNLATMGGYLGLRYVL